jgi:hypothetical protein
VRAVDDREHAGRARGGTDLPTGSTSAVGEVMWLTETAFVFGPIAPDLAGSR